MSYKESIGIINKKYDDVIDEIKKIQDKYQEAIDILNKIDEVDDCKKLKEELIAKKNELNKKINDITAIKERLIEAAKREDIRNEKKE